MSFVEQDDIISLFEEMTKYLFKTIRHYDLGETPFIRLPWIDAMRRFGSDKPDMRFGMEFVELMDTLKGTGSFGVFNEAATSAVSAAPAAPATPANSWTS